MPLGILTDEQLNKELGRTIEKKDIDKIEGELAHQSITPKIVDIKRGRGNTLEIPNEIRALVAEEAIINGHTKEIATQFGISKSSVDAYKNGATSTTTYNEPDKSLSDANKQVRDVITDKARGRLMSALDAITDENIGNAKVKDIASIAKDMSVIVKNMEPNVPVDNSKNTQVIIYRPRMRDEDEFDVITVNE